MRSYRAKQGTYGRYQLHGVEFDFEKETVKVSDVKIGLHFKNRYYNVEKKKAKIYLLFFIAYLLF